MGKQHRLKMAKKNVNKNETQEKKVEGETEPTAAREMQPDEELNFQEGVGNAGGGDGDDLNAQKEIGREAEMQEEDQEKIELPESSKMDSALGFVEGVEDIMNFQDNSGTEVGQGEKDQECLAVAESSLKIPDEAHPVTPENASQSHADAETKERGDLYQGDHDAEEIRKRKGKGKAVYHSDPDEDSKDNKPDDDLSDDETLTGYKEEICEKLGMLPESLDGFDVGNPIGTKKFPAPRMMKKNKAPLPTSSYGN